jgi:hypothetical protein
MSMMGVAQMKKPAGGAGLEGGSMLADDLQLLRVAVERAEREYEGCPFPYLREAADRVERGVYDAILGALGGSGALDRAVKALELILGAAGSGTLPKALQGVIDGWLAAEAARLGLGPILTLDGRRAALNAELKAIDEDFEIALLPTPEEVRGILAPPARADPAAPQPPNITITEGRRSHIPPPLAVYDVGMDVVVEHDYRESTHHACRIEDAGYNGAGDRIYLCRHRGGDFTVWCKATPAFGWLRALCKGDAMSGV